MDINYKEAVSIDLFTRVCPTDALLLNWPGMSICKNLSMAKTMLNRPF
mgnify:CR=1 FL=1